MQLCTLIKTDHCEKLEETAEPPLLPQRDRALQSQRRRAAAPLNDTRSREDAHSPLCRDLEALGAALADLRAASRSEGALLPLTDCCYRTARSEHCCCLQSDATAQQRSTCPTQRRAQEHGRKPTNPLAENLGPLGAECLIRLTAGIARSRHPQSTRH